MRVLNCLLVREGPSDEWFLAPLLQRALVNVVGESFDEAIEIMPIRTLRADHQRPHDVVEAAKGEDGDIDVLLYHHDGAPQASSAALVGRMRKAWAARAGAEPLIPVVPVRETEAWALADQEALADVLRLTPSSVAKVVPDRGAAVEGIRDPKQALKMLVAPTRGAGARRRHHEVHEDLFERMANRISLTRLRTLPSFARWWDEMTHALEGLGYRHG